MENNRLQLHMEDKLFKKKVDDVFMIVSTDILRDRTRGDFDLLDYRRLFKSRSARITSVLE